MPGRSLLFVSDLHLDATSADAVAQFCRFLQHEARGSDGLYILGDLFETWIGDDDDEAARTTICEALRTLVQSGTPCWVMRGNRDFFLGPGFERRTGCTLLPDPVLLQFGKVRAVLSHGDMLCTADTGYQKYRTLTRRKGFIASFLALPLSLRRAIARATRATSRENTRQLRNEITDVSAAAVIAALRSGRSDLLIHGHTHRPAVHEHLVDGRRAQRIVLGDWYDQGSCLVLHADATYELVTLPARRSESGTADRATQ